MKFFFICSNSSPLLIAIENNHLDVVKFLLADKKTDVNIKLILNQIIIKFLLYFNGIINMFLNDVSNCFFFTKFISQMFI